MNTLYKIAEDENSDFSWAGLLAATGTAGLGGFILNRYIMGNRDLKRNLLYAAGFGGAGAVGSVLWQKYAQQNRQEENQSARDRNVAAWKKNGGEPPVWTERNAAGDEVELTIDPDTGEVIRKPEGAAPKLAAATLSLVTAAPVNIWYGTRLAKTVEGWRGKAEPELQAKLQEITAYNAYNNRLRELQSQQQKAGETLKAVQGENPTGRRAQRDHARRLKAAKRGLDQANGELRSHKAKGAPKVNMMSSTEFEKLYGSRAVTGNSNSGYDVRVKGVHTDANGNFVGAPKASFGSYVRAAVTPGNLAVGALAVANDVGSVILYKSLTDDKFRGKAAKTVRSIVNAFDATTSERPQERQR